MDRLSLLFSRLSLSASVFYADTLCGGVDFANARGAGILHVLRRGCVRVLPKTGAAFDVAVPSIFFYRANAPHRFEVDDASGADLVCSFVDFGDGAGNSALRGLPEFLAVPMAQAHNAAPTVALLFDEAFARRDGHAGAIDRLVEVLALLLMRYALDAKIVETGTVAALGDERLAKAIVAMHAAPERAWSLEDLAQTAGMSRARFAALFREMVGAAPLDYLTEWRIGVAQTLLKQGKSVKAAARATGYSNAAAFARVFIRRTGLSPRDWLAR